MKTPNVWIWLKKLFERREPEKEVIETGDPAHPVLWRQRANSIVYGRGGIGLRRLTHPAGGINLTRYRYWCVCGTELTEGPWGSSAVNAVCTKCNLNYGCLPGYHGDN